MMSETLLPCPFCGSENVMLLENGEIEIPRTDMPGEIIYDTPMFIYCPNCNFYTDTYASKSIMIAKWNRRAQPENKPLTNADHIRSMSDEGLAEWLVDANMCERVCIEEDYCGCDVCVNRVTDWLKQPAKEEHHEVD